MRTSCRTSTRPSLITTGAALLPFALALATVATLRGQPAPEAPRLSVERIASLPSFTGTAPQSPVWSPDSTRVAFLWNDEGLRFRDVWVAQASGGPPVRLTRLGAGRTPPPADDTSLAGLRATQQFRAAGGVSDVLWTPDGRAIVFSHRGELYRVAAEGGPPEPLTTTGGGKSQPSFSPDGRWLAFLQQGDLYLRRAADGETVRATHAGEPPIGATPGGRFYGPDVEIRSFAWSPDSRRIAFVHVDRREVRQVPFPDYLTEETSMNVLRRAYPGDEAERRTLAVYTLADGVTRHAALPEPAYRNIIGFEWAPDGSRLLVESDEDAAETRWLHLIDPAGMQVREIYRDHRERRIYSFFTSTWRSDGEAVIFICDTDHYRLCSIPVAGGEPVMLTRGPFDVAGSRGAATVTVARPSRQVFFESTQKSPYERQVYRMPDQGGEIVQVTTLAGVHTPFVAPDGARVAVLHSSDTTPEELYIVEAAGGAGERRITQSPPAEFARYRWAAPKYVTFKSRIDDFTLHGRLLVPADLQPGRKYPVVLGSVYSNTVRNEWRGLNSTLQQFMALEGQYINLQVDLRGSVGYGVKFREAFQGDWGGGDLEDVHSAVDYLKTLPYVDADRIGIWGSSYGGMMVLFALFEKPGMFAAGVSGAPAIEVARFTSNDQHLSRRPNSHPHIFRKSTLLNYGEKLEDPLLLIHGVQDDVVPFKSTVAMAEKLIALGKDFDLAIAPRSAHGWTQQEHYAVFMLRKLVQHFDRHLGRGPTATGTQP